MSVTPSAISAGVSDVAPPLVTTCRYNEVLPRPLLFRNHFTANGLTTCVGELLGSFRQLGFLGVSGRKQYPGALVQPTDASNDSCSIWKGFISLPACHPRSFVGVHGRRAT